MSAIVLATEQRTEAWHRARLGRVTASRANDMCQVLKGKGEAAPRRDLRVQLVCEQLTGISHERDVYHNKEIQRGIDREGDARAAYEAATGAIVEAVGFLAHPELMAGCSPDGLIGREGVLEIKCPKAATHLASLRARQVPPEYLPQCTHALWITGAAWCDFVSFDDRFPPSLQLVVVRVARVEAEIAAHELLVRIFLGEVARELADVARMAAA